MIKVNKLTDYAVIILSYFATQSSDRVFNASQLASALDLPNPTVSKILKILLKNQFVISHRGAQGGYQLAKPLEYITVAQLIEAMEGRVAVTECSSVRTGLCSHEMACQMRNPWQKINHMVLNLLSQVTLADMRDNRE
ncbi:MAG: SUF system Fe-S cluster assembly regulator [Gammaproteobacteria bacterium]|jgi:FeS assembly SUF system regulator